VSRNGDFYENRMTGEFVVVLRGDEDSDADESAIAHLTVKPQGATTPAPEAIARAGLAATSR
jgi:hypothetical protein